MNNRIKELAEEAGFIPGVMGLNRFTYFDTEKFAELIVRECLYNMENCDGDLDFAIWKTKQDFGVKETITKGETE
jgi:hypothetical protein